jgi:hypothetical protein
MAVFLKSSERYPVGTTVKAFPWVNAHESAATRPSGTALAEATVAANGSLTFSGLGDGLYSLFAEVGSDPRTVKIGSGTFPPYRTLRERIASRRVGI